MIGVERCIDVFLNRDISIDHTVTYGQICD
jgi:hypothetical protein